MRRRISLNRQILLQQLRVISPLWTIKIGRKLKDHSSMKRSCLIKGIKLDLEIHQYCVIGEAYNFEDIFRLTFNQHGMTEYHFYKCASCAKYSEAVDRTLPDTIFWEQLKLFIIHFKDKHKRRYIKKLEIAIKEKENAKNLLL